MYAQEDKESGKMLAKRELRKYAGDVRVWVGRYKNLTNLPHWHDDCEIVYADKGGAEVSVGGELMRLPENGAVFIEPRSTHYIRAEKDGVLSFFLFDRRLIKNVTAGRTLRSPLLGGDYGLPRLYELIDGELSSDAPLRTLSVNNRIERLVIDIYTNEPLGSGERKENYMEERYKKLLKDIDEKYADYTLAEAAAFTALSESYFSKFFKQMANMTFSQYLNLTRVEKAIEMMRGGDCTMTKTAIACGFGTIRNFNRVFKEITGYSPKNLPRGYNALGLHPTYGVDDTFDPTSAGSELL